MQKPNQSGAGKPENLNSPEILLPVYTPQNDPHKDHKGYLMKLRESKGRAADIMYCAECHIAYTLTFRIGE